MLHTCSQTTDDARATDGGVHDGDHVPELGLEGGVKVGATLNSTEAVAVSQLCKDTDVAAIFKLKT